MKKLHYPTIALASCLMMIAAGCRKPAPVQPPPPPPPKQEVPEEKPAPPRSTITSFTADPTTIQRGESSTLKWATSNATEITISPGIGAVAASGSRQVFPSTTTTYELATRGPGGNDSRTVTVNVTAPPPPPPPPPPKPKVTRSLVEALASEVADAYFDYDKFDIREDARSVLTRNADALKRILSEFPGSVITIEGHCDERGSGEYNLGLGDRRGTAAKDFLTQLGVPADRLRVISYGKERPQCTESDESCWQRNRRVHFATQ
jgi:peptidoglycan-associated lipoprotein